MERNALKTVVEMRSYGYTEDKKNYEAGMRHLADLKRVLAEAKAHSDKFPELVKLREHLTKAQAKLADYEKALQETVSRMEAIAGVRRTLDVAAAEFVKYCDEYLDSQQKKLREEIAKASAPEVLQDPHRQGRCRPRRIIAAAPPSGRQLPGAALPRYPPHRGGHQGLASMDQIVETLRAKTREDVNQRQLAGIREASQKYRQALLDFVDNFKAVQDLNSKRMEVANAVQQAANDTALAGMGATQDVANEAVSSLSAASTVMIAGLAVALLFGIVIAIFLTKAITGPVVKGVQFAKAMAEGDFTRTLEIDQKDEIGVLAASLNEMVGKLREVVAEIQSASENVASGSEETVRLGPEHVQGATEQAASVEEISSSMEQMSSNIKQNAENAQQTQSIAVKAAQDAREGGEPWSRPWRP